jgi:hypothetical protein
MWRWTMTRAPLRPPESFPEVRSHSREPCPQACSPAGNTRRLKENSEKQRIRKEEISLAQLLLRTMRSLTINHDHADSKDEFRTICRNFHEGLTRSRTFFKSFSSNIFRTESALRLFLSVPASDIRTAEREAHAFARLSRSVGNNWLLGSDGRG